MHQIGVDVFLKLNERINIYEAKLATMHVYADIIV